MLMLSNAIGNYYKNIQNSIVTNYIRPIGLDHSYSLLKYCKKAYTLYILFLYLDGLASKKT